MRYRNTLILFARAPLICRVKTRMWPALTHRQCLYLHRCLIAGFLKSFKQVFNTVIYTTQMAHYPVKTRLQHGNDLGMRMFHAMSHELKHSEKVILIGSDCPQVDQTYISQAFSSLDSNRDIILGPANDGGYFLIGAKRVSPALFKNVSWGTSNVLAETQLNIKKLGLNAKVLDQLIDVDTVDDLKELKQLNLLPVWAKSLL